MINSDIISAAFKVWGRDFYRTTSLSDIALELGVSKAALYRHFKGKGALVEAMYAAFFDSYTLFIKDGYEKAVSAAKKQESGLIIMRSIAEYYIRNKDAFIFCLAKVYGGREIEYMGGELRKRGIDMLHPHFADAGDTYPSGIQLATVTLIYYIAAFHASGAAKLYPSLDEAIKTELAGIEAIVVKGLNLDAGLVLSVDYERLERQVKAALPEETDENSLLKAAAEAVAEAGPWNASMKMVAKRSGLSKSGLYAHFKNKQDMLSRLFITEFSKIANYAKTQIETTKIGEEQLYLAIISIVNYLGLRPEILVSIDWLRTGRMDLGKEIPERISAIIGDIKIDAIRNYDRNQLVSNAQWILFLIVNTLLWLPSPENTFPPFTLCGNNRVDGLKLRRQTDWRNEVSRLRDKSGKILPGNTAELSAGGIHALFRFIALGLEGLS